MLVSSTSPPNLSLIDLLITEIYYRTGIAGNTDTQTESDTFHYSPDIGYKSRVIIKVKLVRDDFINVAIKYTV